MKFHPQPHSCLFFLPSCVFSSFFETRGLRLLIQDVIEEAKNSTNDNISMSDIKGFNIPLPPLEEQKAIVEVVNSLFEEVDQLESLTKERIQLKESFVVSALNRLTEAENTQEEWNFLQEHFSSFFTEKKKGDLMARISSDVLELQHSFLSILELIIRDPLTILFSLIVMFSFSTKLTFFVLVFIPLSGAIISQIGKSLRRKSARVQNEQGEFLSILEETLGGIKIIKAFNAQNKFVKKFGKSTQRFFHFSNKLLNRQNLASPISEFLGILVISGLLWFGGRMVLVDQTLSGAIFLSYLGLAYNILTPAKGISKAFYNIKKGDAAAQRVLDILEAKDDMEDTSESIGLEHLRKGIKFEKVSFSYGNKSVLENFSIKLYY